MNKQNNCAKCGYEIKGSLFFSCGHELCPFCYVNIIFDRKFRGVLLEKNRFHSSCPFCSHGLLDIELIKFNNFLSQNKITNPVCAKHRKKTSDYCKECNLYLCSDCLSLFHNDYFKNHTVTKFPSFMGTKLKKFCSLHQNKKLKFKCQTCACFCCSSCFLANHAGHEVVKNKDLIDKAISNIKFKEYEDFLSFLNNNETNLRDTVRCHFTKNIQVIDETISMLEKAKDEYIKSYENDISFIGNLFNYQRDIYYYYYGFINSNDPQINPILKYTETEKGKSDPQLKNKRIFTFTNINFRAPGTLSYLLQIQQDIKKFSKEKGFIFRFSQLYLVSGFARIFNNTTNNPNDNRISSIACIPGKKIVFADGSGKLIIFSSQKPYNLLYYTQAHQSKICSMKVIYITDPQLLITGSADKTINVYDVNDKFASPLFTFKGHKQEITVMTIYNGGEYFPYDPKKNVMVISGSKDKNIKLWDVVQQKYIQTLCGHKEKVTALMVTKNYKLLSSSKDKTIIVWDLETCKPSLVHDTKISLTIKVMIPYKDKYMLISKGNNQFEIEDAETFESKMKPLSGHNQRVTCLGYLKDSDQVISCSKDRFVCLWDIETKEGQGGQLNSVICNHSGPISALSIDHDDSRIIATGDKNGGIVIWEEAY